MTYTISTSYSHWGLIADAELAAHLSAELAQEQKAKPAIPTECWNVEPVDADACMAAVRAMCKGG
jgi:hypothetical protein